MEENNPPHGNAVTPANFEEKFVSGMYSFPPPPSLLSVFLSLQALCQQRLATVTGERSSWRGRRRGIGDRQHFLFVVAV